MCPPSADAATRHSPYLPPLQNSLSDHHQHHHSHLHYQPRSASSSRDSPISVPHSRSWPPVVSTSNISNIVTSSHNPNGSVFGPSASSSAAPSSTDGPDDLMDLSPSSTPKPASGPQLAYHSRDRDPPPPIRRPSSAERYVSHPHMLVKEERCSSVGDRSVPDDHSSYRHRQPLSGLSTNIAAGRRSPPAVSVQMHDDGGSDSEKSSHNNGGGSQTGSSNLLPGQSNGALGPNAQSKVQSAAFIHKLYSMLEDPKISHLIYWSDGNDSFIMSPCSEFSKVLSSYFKHTNISSFVRQLNMYGFHKVVSDAFQTASPDTPIWEFRHGNGSFNRGDLDGLREIKRRASRHHMISRDSFSGSSSKVPISGPPMIPTLPSVSHQPPEHMQHPHLHPAPVFTDPFEARLAGYEQHFERRLYDQHVRFEEAFSAVNSRCQSLTKGLQHATTWSQQLCTVVLRLIPEPNHPIRQDILNLQHNISGQLEALHRGAEETVASSSRHPSFQAPHSAPLQRPSEGPSQMYHSENYHYPQPGPYRGHRPSIGRFPDPNGMPPTTRFGSQSGPDSTTHSINPRHSTTLMPPPPPPPSGFPPVQAPHLSAHSPPGGFRRHTSGDIRQHNWNPQGSQHPLAESNGPQWPPSPTGVPSSANSARAENQNIRETLASFNFGQPSRPPARTRPVSPPPLSYEGGPPSDHPSSSQNEPHHTSRFQFGPNSRHFSSSLELPLPVTAPSSRRTSMASNVHSLLNPDRRPSDDDLDSPGPKRRRR